MPDPFSNYTPGLESPATVLEPVTPNDTADLTAPSRALNVQQSGAVRVSTTGGSTATLFVGAGICFPVRATRVWATGTTALGITAML